MKINYADQLSDQRLFDRKDKRDIPEYWTAETDAGVIATAHYQATRIGAVILAQGGNAVDAAVAASLALGVCEPAASGLGGMSMMLVHHAAINKTVIVKGPCHAPHRADPENLLDQPRSSGYQAVAIPTTPAVLDYTLGRYGTLDREQVIAPARELAREGYPVTHLQYNLTLRYRNALAKQNGGHFFLGSDGQPLAPGTIFRQPILAATLDRMAQVGFRDFYQGEIADKIVQDMQRHGGFIDRQDMQNIPWPEESEPLTLMIGDQRICTLGPPGGGIVLLQLLQLLHAAPNDFEPDSPRGVLFLANAIRRARKDRMRHFRMESGVEKGTPSPRLTAEYAQMVAAEIGAKITSSGETTHICVTDRHGNAVSLTQSIERVFGAKVVTADLGFLYNGYLKAFNLTIPTHPHYLQPGARRPLECHADDCFQRRQTLRNNRLYRFRANGFSYLPGANASATPVPFRCGPRSAFALHTAGARQNRSRPLQRQGITRPRRTRANRGKIRAIFFQDGRATAHRSPRR